MGVLDTAKHAIARRAIKIAQTLSIKSTSPSLWNNSSFGGVELPGRNFSSDESQLNAYQQVAWAAIAVDHLMADAGGRPWYFENEKGEELDIKKIDERISTPIINGYGKQSLSTLMGAVVGQRALTGNALFLKMAMTLYGERYKIKEVFIPIKPGNFKPLISSSGLVLSGYEIRFEDGSRRNYSPEDVIHFTQNTLNSPFIGIGSIEKARLMYETEVRKEKFQNQFFKNGASPSMVVTDGSDRNAADIERINKLLEEKYQGEKNAGRIMYLSGKEMDAKALAISNKDMQFLEEKQFNRQTTLSLFGVPQSVAGIPDGSNRAISDNERLTYLENTINPIIRQLEEAINTQHVHLIDRKIFFRFREHLTGDVDKTIKMIQGGIITPNKGAEILGCDMDETDESRNMYYMPANMVPIESLGIVSEPTPTEPVPAKMNGKSIDDICEAFEKSVSSPKKFQARYLRAALKGRAQTEEKYTQSLETFFKKQRNRVIKNLNANEDKIRRLIDTNKGAKLLEDNVLEVIFDISQENELLKEEVKRLHTSGVQKGIVSVNDIAGSTVNFALSNMAVANLISRLGKQIVDSYDINGNRISLNETTRKMLAKNIIDGIQQGVTIDEMQTSLIEEFDKFTPYRARRIARTESRAAYDEGAKLAYKDLDVKTIDVVGCTQFEPDSDCGAQNVPIDRPLSFHPNHIGVVVPHLEP